MDKQDGKTMRVSASTHEALRSLGAKGESFDSIIKRLLSEPGKRGGTRLHSAMYHRKLLLRKEILGDGLPSGMCYMPFIDNDDLAYDLYRKMEIWGMGVNLRRIAEVEKELPGAIIVGGIAEDFPFDGVSHSWRQLPAEAAFDVADFNAPVNPYPAFQSFWKKAKKADKMDLFFSDGLRQGIVSAGNLIRPSGRRSRVQSMQGRADLYNNYLDKVVFKWFRQQVKPYQVVKTGEFTGGAMCFWGATIERKVEG